MHGGNHGVKRKRPVDQEDRESKLRRKLYRDVREVRKAGKKAKTFEIQKTLKKLKDARPKDPEGEVTKDLEAQLEALKHINYVQVAHSALMTKLKKDKVLSADPLLQSAISAELASNPLVPGTSGTPTAKVQSRMLSSKVLASEVMSVVEALRNLLHPSGESEELGEPNDRSYESSQARDVIPTINNDEEASSEASDDEDEDAEQAAVDDDGWESGTVSDGGASEAGDWESGSADGHRSKSGEDDPDDVVINPDESDDDGPPLKGLKRQKSQSAASNGQSEFLPSLSVGFARGDPDSEFSDSEAKLADGVKKNRRGQRARRAIWEKKFGKNANHVKKQREIAHGLKCPLQWPSTAPADRRSLGTGSSAQHPFRARPAGYGHERIFTQRTQSQQSSLRLNSRSSKERALQTGHQRPKRDERPLHPSWEAKRKQKSASILPPQGTKIVFPES